MISSSPVSLNSHYASNQPPLAPNPLVKLPLGAVRPEGWLCRQLELMRDGLTGRLPDLSEACRMPGNAWVDAQGLGDHGWEKPPYWLRGYVKMASLLDDAKLLATAQSWMEGVLKSRRADGYFGPEFNRQNNDAWPNMIMLNALEAYHDYTQDARVLELMRGYFHWQLNHSENLLRHIPGTPGEWQGVRGGDNLQSVINLYNRTREPWLIDLAHRISERTLGWEEGYNAPHHQHGVNICQSFRMPAQCAQLTGDTAGWALTERLYQQVMGEYGQFPGGMFGADEPIRPGFTDPRQPAETCSMVEFMRSFQLLLAITGAAACADRCEDVAFNSFPAAQTADLKAIHYFTAPNMVRLDEFYYTPARDSHACMLAFSSDERYACCRYNVAGGWPNFVEHLWMATPDKGLAAVMYGPCTVTARAGDAGHWVIIREETDYPFRERIKLRFTLANPVAFPLMLRVPGWCETARYWLNGTPLEALPHRGFVTITRDWRNGDVLTVQFAMPPRVRVWEKQKGAVSVERGPLSFSLKIDEQWERMGDSGDWPDWRVLPASVWNYGLVGSPESIAASLEVDEASPDVPILEPWTQQSAPVRIQATARRLPQWELDQGLPGLLPASPAPSCEPDERVEFVPMGAARVRISVLPITE